MILIDHCIGPSSSAAEIEEKIAWLLGMPQEDEGVIATLGNCRRYLARAQAREHAADGAQAPSGQLRYSIRVIGGRPLFPDWPGAD